MLEMNHIYALQSMFNIFFYENSKVFDEHFYGLRHFLYALNYVAQAAPGLKMASVCCISDKYLGK